MRFFVGQIYQHVDDGREAVVVEVRKEGQEALLRFANAGEDWALYQTGQWRLKAWPKAKP